MGDTTGDVPEFPYTSMKFTLSGAEVGLPSNEVQELSDKFVMDTEQDMEFTISFTCHGDTNENSFNLAMRAKEYFNGLGTLQLSEYNIAIIETTPVSNRDVYLTIEYERRYGFDLRIRVRAKSNYSVDIIDSVEL